MGAADEHVAALQGPQRGVEAGAGARADAGPPPRVAPPPAATPAACCACSETTCVAQECKGAPERAAEPAAEPAPAPVAPEAAAATPPPPTRRPTLAERMAAMGGVPALGSVPLPPTSPDARRALSPTKSPAAKDIHARGGVIDVTAVVSSPARRAPAAPPAGLPRVGPDPELAAALARRRVE